MLLHWIKKVRRGERSGRRRGFTIVEVTLAVAISLLIATALLAMVSQHLTFMQILQRFDFLKDDAPIINRLMGRMLQQSTTYRIYPDVDSARSGSGAVNSGGDAIRLVFRSPDGTLVHRVVGFDPGAGELGFYEVDSGTPNWVISAKVADVDFDDSSGVILMQITGPNQEEITYSGTTE